MAIIDMVRWAPQGSKMIFAWRFPETNLSTYTQLVVQESQEAVLFSKGQIIGKFGPGKHTLDSENLPLLRSLFRIPFGGKNPFTSEVWFVNKGLTFNIDWHIIRMSIHDVDYNTQLPLTASGQYGLRITDSEKFLVKIVGPREQYTEYDMTEQFTGEINTKVKSALLQFMIRNHVGYKQVSAFLAEMSDHLRLELANFWSELGVELTRFYVSSVDIDDSTPDGAKVKEAIGTQSSMSITGHTWQQEQLFDTATNAIGAMSEMGSGMNGNGGMLGGLMALSLMDRMGRMTTGMTSQGGLMTPQFNQPTFGGSQGANSQGVPGKGSEVREVFCSNCSRKFPSNMEFCPNCGNKYRPCPRCGTDNAPTARRCVSCGTNLAGAPGAQALCPNCSATVSYGASFCGNCGKPLRSQGDVCSRCGTPFHGTVKFCPKCGNRRG